MLVLNDVDWDLPTLNKNPKFGFVPEYIEKKTISGKIVRTVKGKRFQAEFSYAYLTPEQLSNLFALRDAQPFEVEIATPEDKFKGPYYNTVYIEINSMFSRYAYINNQWVWTDINIKLIGEYLR